MRAPDRRTKLDPAHLRHTAEIGPQSVSFQPYNLVVGEYVHEATAFTGSTVAKFIYRSSLPVRSDRDGNTIEIISDLLSMNEAEEVVASIWMYVERNQLPSPKIRFEFDRSGTRVRVRFASAGATVEPSLALLLNRLVSCADLFDGTRESGPTETH